MGPAIEGYRVVDVVASGGFGTVYRAIDRRGTAVAIKVLHETFATNGTACARFEREVKAISGLAHRGIVVILDDGRLADGRPWYAMELLAGRDLEAHLKARRTLAPAECLAILDPIAAALAFAHAHEIVHRDVKASNVFLAGDRVVLLDFGIAKLLEVGTDTLTVTGTVIGTPNALSPEQVRGDAVDARTDVYGLGALLFHMLTGAPPFAGHDAAELGFLHQHAGRPRPSDHSAAPAALDPVVTRAMALEPDARFATPGLFVAAVREVIERPAAATGPSILVEILAPDGALVAPTDAVWSDLEAIRAEVLRLPGVVRSLADTSIVVELVDIAQAIDLAARLRERPTRHPSIEVRLSVDGSVIE